MFASALAAMEAAQAQSRVEQAESEVRLAQFKHAAELERQGRMDEAREVLAAIEKGRRS